MRPFLLLLLTSCAADVSDRVDDTGVPPNSPCPPAVEATLDLAHADEPWGIEGAELGCGIPPQGGAPYTRVRVRVHGTRAVANGAEIDIVATDAATGELLGGANRTAGFVCANVGDNADHWVTSEVHLRYDGFSVDDLLGREVELSATVSAGTSTATAHGHGVLTPL